jgi:divalent metal cation (Fe/Co/Zn/Cd) transporter
LGARTLQSLLDRAPEGVTQEIQKIASATEGILDINNVRVKQAGPLLFITVLANVSRMLPLPQSQALQDQFASDIKKVYPQADVTISLNAVSLDTETAFEKIGLIARQRNMFIHHLTVQNLNGRLAVSFDLEVDGQSKLQNAHEQATELENAIRNVLGEDVEVESHIEPLPLRQLDGVAADGKSTAAISKCLNLLAKSEKSLSDVHNIRVRLSEGELYVHYHCRFAPEQTVDAVHIVVDRVENALKQKFKRIQRVVAHAEPIGHSRHKL